jgi:Polyketide cyclase / dehydrase and lipid transport
MKKLSAVTVCLCLSAIPALALEAKVEKAMPGSAASVWSAIGDFCGISKWHPVVTKCELSEKELHLHDRRRPVAREEL